MCSLASGWQYIVDLLVACQAQIITIRLHHKQFPGNYWDNLSDTASDIHCSSIAISVLHPFKHGLAMPE